MGFVCVFAGLLAGSAKGYMGKRISNLVTTFQQSSFINFIRMLVCIPISLLFLCLDTKNAGAILDGNALVYGTLSGIFMSIFLVTWMLAVRCGAFMLISVAQMFGTVITVLLSCMLFREEILPKQFLGIGILTTSVLIMVSYSSSIKGKLSAGAVILLVSCGLSSGLYDFSLKLFTHFSESSISVLNLITYFISALALRLLFTVTSGGGTFDKKALLKSTFLLVVLMSVCLFLNSYFKALANHYLPATKVYPLYQAGGLILSAVMSSIFFQERINRRCVVGLLLAFFAILLIK